MTFSPNDDDRLWKDTKPKGWFRFSPPLRYVLLLALLIGCVIGLWYLLSPARRNYNTAALALIRADDTPYKVKAKDQGIPSIKHQDKLVYGRIRKDQKDPPVEHILPDPELPLAHIQEDTSSIKMVDQYIPQDIDLEKNTQTSSSPPKETSSSFASIEDLIEDLPQEKPTDAEKTVENEKIPQGHSLIQLGSLKSYDLAESEWKRISAKHKDILDNFTSLIQKVDLGAEKGIYYRLRTGPFENKEKAQDACALLKERKVECLVVH